VTDVEADTAAAARREPPLKLAADRSARPDTPRRLARHEQLSALGVPPGDRSHGVERGLSPHVARAAPDAEITPAIHDLPPSSRRVSDHAWSRE
jgi:hypothetical protein